MKMNVEFQKTGEKRYAVTVRRDREPDLKMDPAPGFDPLIPHDLLHFLIERELGLKKGIFGQIALGGTAGTFHLAETEKSDKRAASRLRRKTKKRGQKLLKGNTDDCARSERATYICLTDWLAHSPEAELRARAGEMKTTAGSILAGMPEAERNAFNPEKLAGMRGEMNELSRRWSALEVGQSITLEWPF